jgi:hypothetical protein
VGAGANQWKAVPHVTSATEPVRNGRASARACAQAVQALDRLASRSIGAEKSAPTTRQPRRASAEATTPGPQPRSSAARPADGPVRAAIAS